MAVPAMGVVTVNVTAAEDGSCGATITITTDANLVRGFGLDLSVDAGTIIAVTPTPGGEYRIFPGQIYVVDGNVIDYNTPYAAGSLGSSSVTVEMASLYTDDIAYEFVADYGYGMRPSASEVVMTVTVSESCTLTITENAARGGVVLEDPDLVPTVNLSGVAISTGCGWAYPACWDYLGQCYADTDGDGSVGLLDFYAFRDSWGKSLASNPPAIPGSPAPGEYNACADTNRDGSIGLLDFYDFRDNWNSSTASDCPTGDLNEIYKP